jgi:alpha 1,2-mannosyltransferase
LITDAEVQFGLIPSEHWNQPDWINETIAKDNRDWMAHWGDVPYAGQVFPHPDLSCD